jgi:hypothetical protein
MYSLKSWWHNLDYQFVGAVLMQCISERLTSPIAGVATARIIFVFEKDVQLLGNPWSNHHLGYLNARSAKKERGS